MVGSADVSKTISHDKMLHYKFLIYITMSHTAISILPSITKVVELFVFEQLLYYFFRSLSFLVISA